jgi:hypothetical protein
LSVKIAYNICTQLLVEFSIDYHYKSVPAILLKSNLQYFNLSL